MNTNEKHSQNSELAEAKTLIGTLRGLLTEHVQKIEDLERKLYAANIALEDRATAANRLLDEALKAQQGDGKLPPLTGYWHHGITEKHFEMAMQDYARAALAQRAGSGEAAFLLPGDLAALKRFAECCEDSDSGGHDVSRQAMSRLTEIGVCRHLGFGNHQTTSFGDYVLELVEGGNVTLPLKTLIERNADAALAAKGN